MPQGQGLIFYTLSDEVTTSRNPPWSKNPQHIHTWITKNPRISTWISMFYVSLQVSTQVWISTLISKRRYPYKDILQWISVTNKYLWMDILVFMDISLQFSMLLWISVWISLDFYGYPCIVLLWILDPGRAATRLLHPSIALPTEGFLSSGRIIWFFGRSLFHKPPNQPLPCCVLPLDDVGAAWAAGAAAGARAAEGTAAAGGTLLWTGLGSIVWALRVWVLGVFCSLSRRCGVNGGNSTLIPFTEQ